MRNTDTIGKGRDEELQRWWECHGPHSDGTHRVSVFLRSFTPRHGHPQQCIETLQTAREVDLVDDYNVTILGNEICICDRCQEQTPINRIIETVTTLREWADSGLEASGFMRRSVDSALAGEQYDMIVPPHLSLGIYDEDALVGVFPCTSGTTDTTYTPATYLRRLDMPDPAISIEERVASVDS